MSSQTYVEAVLDGSALAIEIDDWVDAWHSGNDHLELHEFLGMTWDEYRLWTEKPTSLRFILAAHNAGTDVDSVRLVGTMAAAAARASNEVEAARVVEWLIKTGRIADPKS
jgi:hypothetical protein